jgi:hypothetical protein
MLTTKVVEPHREPTHPPVIAWHFGEGERLPDLLLIPQATRPVLPFNDTGIDLLIAQQRQHVFHPGFAIQDADCDSLKSTSCIVFCTCP